MTSSEQCISDNPASSNLITINIYQAPTQAEAGPDQLNLSGTTATLAGNTPVNGTGQWSIINGTGGNITDPSSPTSTLTGTAGINLTLRWTITNDCGNSTDDIIISFSFKCGNNLIDSRESKSYTTVQIGTQCWMAKNMNVGNRIDGTFSQTNNGSIEKYCYNNDESYCNTYGGIYLWDEMMQYMAAEQTQGICPSGWHIPTDGEWSTLTTSLGGESIAGGKMKEIGTTHWNSSNTGATNSSGFSALPGGYRDYPNGAFGKIGDNGIWWSASDYGSGNKWCRRLSYSDAKAWQSPDYVKRGFSVRCLRNCTYPSEPKGSNHISSQNQIIWKWTSVEELMAICGILQMIIMLQ